MPAARTTTWRSIHNGPSPCIAETAATGEAAAPWASTAATRPGSPCWAPRTCHPPRPRSTTRPRPTRRPSRRYGSVLTAPHLRMCRTINRLELILGSR
ncbi:hypothetical protein JYU34_011831 [Plutella xylostella]|uniref:Uncharacterized protein n=1 Tax=Plutella xylostella TaxID=51655 RepID=A0ABQ7QDM8_PLUXY|nr:hypothetical protein JYU34_011831 [Plutella xylostella]